MHLFRESTKIFGILWLREPDTPSRSVSKSSKMFPDTFDNVVLVLKLKKPAFL
jgi:hypothetical protein